jgi:CSLREA domain-containing protein
MHARAFAPRSGLGCCLLAVALGLAGQTVAATLTVNSAADAIANDAACTLREAITQINSGGPAANGCSNSGGAFGTSDEIRFSIPGAGVHTIAPTSALPTIVAPVFVNGYSQPGASTNNSGSGWNAVILVELDGSGAGASASGLEFVTTGSRVSGLAVFGFSEVGIRLGSGSVSGDAASNTVDGNIVGLRADGITAAANGVYGVSIAGLGLASNNTIGGLTASARNIISGNLAGGVLINAEDNNTVRGNFIGTDAAGTMSRGNSPYGVFINQASNNVVSANLISGNLGDGVYVAGDTSSDNVITNNVIGATLNLTIPLPNRLHGVHVIRGLNSMIGGTSPGEGNVIAYNLGAGILIGNLHPNTGHSILGNSIYANQTLGIALASASVDTNDPGDVDIGYNDRQNYPVLASALPSGSISGSLNSLANTTFRVEFFTSPACHFSGHGEGRVFLGAGSFTTDGAGNVPVSIAAGALTAGHVVTATATNQITGDTSEFSACLTVASASAPEIQVAGALAIIADGDTTPWIMDYTDFGATTVGTPVTLKYEVFNIGSATLTLGANAVGLSGASCAEFSVIAQPADTLAPGATTTFQVRYTPTNTDTDVCTVSVDNDDADESPYDFTVQGRAEGTPAPEISIAGNGVVIAHGDATPTLADWTDFGVTTVGAPLARSFAIANGGSANLNLGADPVTLSGAGCAEFSISVQPGSAWLIPGLWGWFYVQYLPTDLGTDTCTVTVNNDDANESPYTFVIQAAAGAPGPEIGITGNGVPIMDGDTTPAMTDWTDFGTTAVGTPVTRSFVIANTGTTALNLGASAVILSGAACDVFSVTAQPATTVAAAGSTTFEIRYLPTSPGADACTVNVNSDDADEGPYEFTVQGAAANPASGAAAIPTLSSWSLGWLSCMLSLAFYLGQRRRRQPLGFALPGRDD